MGRVPKALTIRQRRTVGRFPLLTLESKLSSFASENAPRLQRKGVCAEEEIRTPTAVTPLPPQSSASTNFATSAGSAKLTKRIEYSNHLKAQLHPRRYRNTQHPHAIPDHMHR